MKITPVRNYTNYSRPQHLPQTHAAQSFCGGTKPVVKTTSSIFPKFKQLCDKVKNWLLSQPKPVIHGTILPDAKPLPKFFDQFATETEREAVIKRGSSTNIYGQAYSLLKSKADNPLSTSMACDCSVIYLYNDKTNTHLIFHMFSKTNYKELNHILSTYMPEGCTSAKYIPGDRNFRSNHLNSWQDVKLAVGQQKLGVPYYSESPYAEIVGYKGQVFEIPNKKMLEVDRRTYIGQRTFKNCELLTYEIERKIGACNSFEDIEECRKAFIDEKYDETLYPVLDNLLEKRKNLLNSLSKEVNLIDNCKTIEDIERLEAKFTQDEYSPQSFWLLLELLDKKVTSLKRKK